MSAPHPSSADDRSQRFTTTLAVTAIVLVGLWFRAPLISEGMPYFYAEDEGHHFNRLVEMVKTGDLNPNYFNKPSLHFYLRLPAVVGAFLWSARANEIASVQDVVTRDPTARGGWSWSASHPRIVEWTRIVSLLFSLLAVVMTYLITAELVQTRWVALGAAWLVACSPSLVNDAAKIGVDTLMMSLSLVAIYLALKVRTDPTVQRVALAGLFAGLAVSAKYNALPIAVLPLVALLVSGRCTGGRLTVALAMPAVGFFAATPYALVNIPQFLDGMAFEVRHYAVLGHGFATGEPGLPQARYYLGWMSNVAIGSVGTVLGLIGALLLWTRGWRGPAVFLVFPILFSILMINQRVNFFRNMLVMVPVLCILAMVAVGTLARWGGRVHWPRPWMRHAVIPVLLVLVSAQPFAHAVRDRSRRATTPPESRVQASRWLADTATPYSDTAIALELQFPRAVYERTGVTGILTEKIEPVDLLLDGFDRVVVGPEFVPTDNGLLEIEQRFPGEREAQTIRYNPEVTVYALPAILPSLQMLADAVSTRPRSTLTPPVYTPRSPLVSRRDWACASVDANDEGVPPSRELCWAQSRLVQLGVDPALLAATSGATGVAVTLDLMTPWPEQACTLMMSDWSSDDLCVGLRQRRWERRSITVPVDVVAQQAPFWLRLRHVHSPRTQGVRNDPRRLGLAVRAIELAPAQSAGP